MKRTAMTMAMAMLVSAGIAGAAQEPIAVSPASPVQGGKVSQTKTMTVVGVVKAVAADSLTVNEGPGRDETFMVDATTKIIARAGQEQIAVGPASPVQGGKVDAKGGTTAGQEQVAVGPASPVQGGKVIAKPLITDIVKEGQRVQVKYRDVDGKMHATQVRVR